MPYSMNFMLLADRYLPNTTVIRQLTCGTRKLDLKRQADRSPAASSEQSDTPERRNRPNRPWKINRRRNRVIAVVRDCVENTQLSVVRRIDVWDLLLEPFLDTEFTPEQQEQTLTTLKRIGIPRTDVMRIRRSVQGAVLAYNFFLWNWVHLGLVRERDRRWVSGRF